MARPAKHSSEAILDAARALLLDGGPRAASVAAIATASGAPVGTLYHRFGTRDALVAEVWLRALTRFQDAYLGAATTDDPRKAGAEMAAAVVTFARTAPADAQLLMATSLHDLLDGAVPDALSTRLEAANAPLTEALRTLARRCYGRADARHVDRVRLAVVDLPAAALRRWSRAGAAPPSWAETEVAAAAARILANG
jgi:AcrR family transcriptional regulator